MQSVTASKPSLRPCRAAATGSLRQLCGLPRALRHRCQHCQRLSRRKQEPIPARDRYCHSLIDPPSQCCPSPISAATRSRTISAMALPRTLRRSCHGSPSSWSSRAIQASSTKARRWISGWSVGNWARATCWKGASGAAATASALRRSSSRPATGAHRWAERYDRELHDVFAVQDEVARAIVAILAAHVNRAETERALLKPPAAWEAYEYYLRGAEAFFLHYSRRTKASLYDARRLLEQSLAIDPTYARAAAMLSWTYVHAYVQPSDGDYLSPAALDRALELAETAVHLDPRLPQARAQLGQVLLYKGQHDAAIAEFERAFALNPNYIDHRFA